MTEREIGMNIFEILALADWITPAISGARQVKDRMVTWPAYQGGGKDLILAERVLDAAEIACTHHTFARALFVHPSDLRRADRVLQDAGFVVKKSGRIKKK